MHAGEARRLGRLGSNSVCEDARKGEQPDRHEDCSFAHRNAGVARRLTNRPRREKKVRPRESAGWARAEGRARTAEVTGFDLSGGAVIVASACVARHEKHDRAP